MRRALLITRRLSTVRVQGLPRALRLRQVVPRRLFVVARGDIFHLLRSERVDVEEFCLKDEPLAPFSSS